MRALVPRDPAPTLTWLPHPLTTAERKLYRTPFRDGESLTDYLARLDLPLGPQPVALCLNDRFIPRKDWPLTFPRAGDLITMRALVEDGGGDSNPLRTVLTIALLVFAPEAIGFLSWGLGVSEVLATGLVYVGGMMLIDRIAPIPQAKVPDGRAESSSPTYALSGASNRARQFEPLPLVCGAHRIYPDLGAKLYTEFHGKDQYLYAVFNFGLSDVTLSDYRIGDTPLTDFSGYDLEESDATGALTLFPANVDTIAGGSLTAAAGWISRTSSLNATALAVDITGLLFYAGDGGLETRHVDLEIEYRAVGSPTWLPFLNAPSNGAPTWKPNTYFGNGFRFFGSKRAGPMVIPTVWNGHQYERYGSGNTGPTEPVWPTASGAFVADGDPYIENSSDDTSPTIQPGWNEAGTFSSSNVHLANGSRDPVRVSYRRTVVSGQYEVRVRRVTADETDARATSDLSFAQLRTYQPDTADYTGQKRVALRIKASGQLQGVLDQFNAIATGQVPVWTGAAWVTQATSNPAWWYLWFARGKTIGGKRVFGGLLADARLDIEALKAWGAWCDTKGLTFNYVFDQAQNCKEMLAIIARCGRGAPTWASGKLGVIYDEANLPAVAVFGMGNIKRNSFKVQYLSGPVADEIVVQFINPDLGWQPDTVRVTVPGVASPTKPVTVQLLGCANKIMAGKEANLMAAAQVYRKRQISWECDFEGMVAQRGDVVVLSHDLTQWGYSGRCLAGDGTTLTLDRQVPFTPSVNHYVGVVFPNGYYQIFGVAYNAGQHDIITLTDAWPTVDDLGNTLYTPSSDPNHPPYDYKFVFEPLATPGKKGKITAVQPLSEYYVRLTATDEDPNYYAAETNPYNYVPPATYGSRAPSISNLTIHDTLIRSGIGYGTTISLAWDATGPYGGATISVGLNAQPRGIIGRTTERSFSFQGPAEGALDIEVQLFGPNGETKAAGKSLTTYVILGKSARPSDVTGFSASQNGRFVVFRWNEIADVDRDGYEIRRTPQGVTDWSRGQTVTVAEQGTQMTSGVVPPGSWTFLIRAKDTSGNFSVNSARYDLDVTNALDVIFQHQQAPDWLGTKSNFLVHWTGVLVPESTKAANLHTNAELFEQFVPYPQAICTYEAPEIDLGFDSDVRVWADLQAALGRGRTGIADPQLSIDYHIAAGAYDGFEDWTTGDVRARYIKEKLTLDTSKGVAYVSGMLATADSEEFPQSGEFVSALGGVSIVFPDQYHVVTDFQVTPSGAASRSATYQNLTGTGALAHIWDAAGNELAGVPARWSASGV